MKRISILAEWRRIKKLALSKNKSEEAIIEELRVLEPIAPINRIRAGQLLNSDRKYEAAQALLKSARSQGQAHPLIEYHLVAALWGASDKNAAFRLAKNAVKRWGLSYNHLRLSQLYFATGQVRLGDLWFERAHKAALRERRMPNLTTPNPFIKKRARR